MEKALARELLQADEQGASGEGGGGIIGGVIGPRRAQGEHLPPALPARGQKIREPIGGGAEVAYAVGPGKRGGVEEDAARPLPQRQSASHDMRSSRATGKAEKTSARGSARRGSHLWPVKTSRYAPPASSFLRATTVFPQTSLPRGSRSAAPRRRKKRPATATAASFPRARPKTHT